MSKDQNRKEEHQFPSNPVEPEPQSVEQESKPENLLEGPLREASDILPGSSPLHELIEQLGLSESLAYQMVAVNHPRIGETPASAAPTPNQTAATSASLAVATEQPGVPMPQPAEYIISEGFVQRDILRTNQDGKQLPFRFPKKPSSDKDLAEGIGEQGLTPVSKDGPKGAHWEHLWDKDKISVPFPIPTITADVEDAKPKDALARLFFNPREEVRKVTANQVADKIKDFLHLKYHDNHPIRPFLDALYQDCKVSEFLSPSSSTTRASAAHVKDQPYVQKELEFKQSFKNFREQDPRWTSLAEYLWQDLERAYSKHALDALLITVKEVLELEESLKKDNQHNRGDLKQKVLTEISKLKGLLEGWQNCLNEKWDIISSASGMSQITKKSTPIDEVIKGLRSIVETIHGQQDEIRDAMAQARKKMDYHAVKNDIGGKIKEIFTWLKKIDDFAKFEYLNSGWASQGTLEAKQEVIEAFFYKIHLPPGAFAMEYAAESYYPYAKFLGMLAFWPPEPIQDAAIFPGEHGSVFLPMPTGENFAKIVDQEKGVFEDSDSTGRSFFKPVFLDAGFDLAPNPPDPNFLTPLSVHTVHELRGELPPACGFLLMPTGEESAAQVNVHPDFALAQLLQQSDLADVQQESSLDAL